MWQLENLLAPICSYCCEWKIISQPNFSCLDLYIIFWGSKSVWKISNNQSIFLRGDWFHSTVIFMFVCVCVCTFTFAYVFAWQVVPQTFVFFSSACCVQTFAGFRVSISVTFTSKTSGLWSKACLIILIISFSIFMKNNCTFWTVIIKQIISLSAYKCFNGLFVTRSQPWNIYWMFLFPILTKQHVIIGFWRD